MYYPAGVGAFSCETFLSNRWYFPSTKFGKKFFFNKMDKSMSFSELPNQIGKGARDCSLYYIKCTLYSRPFKETISLH